MGDQGHMGDLGEWMSQGFRVQCIGLGVWQSKGVRSSMDMGNQGYRG